MHPLLRVFIMTGQYCTIQRSVIYSSTGYAEKFIINPKMHYFNPTAVQCIIIIMLA